MNMRNGMGNLLVGLFELYGRLPLSVAGKVGHLLGRVIWHLAVNSKQVTIRNIELCFPELNSDDQQKLAKASLLETGQTMGEIASVWVQPGQIGASAITHVDNQELMDAALSQQKGVVLIAPHFGNWELANLYAAQHFPLAVMYKPVSLPALDRLIHSARSFYGSDLLTADRKGVIGLFGALRKAKVVGVLPDQEPTVTTGVWAPFFGVSALTPKIISQLVQKTGAPALGFGCQRNPDGKTFHIFYEPVAEEMYSEDMVCSATALNECIERIVLRDPKQYQWEYKRFKRRPDKTPNPYG